MKKYVYENATVYITIPTEEQVKNIHKATERFVRLLAREGLISNECRRQDNSRTGVGDIDARRRDQKTKKKDN